MTVWSVQGVVPDLATWRTVAERLEGELGVTFARCGLEPERGGLRLPDGGEFAGPYRRVLSWSLFPAGVAGPCYIVQVSTCTRTP